MGVQYTDYAGVSLTQNEVKEEMPIQPTENYFSSGRLLDDKSLMALDEKLPNDIPLESIHRTVKTFPSPHSRQRSLPHSMTYVGE